MKINKFKKPEVFTEEQFAKLREAMCYLSQTQRRVIYLRFWYNMSINEISRKIGLSWDSTDRMIDEAINHLRIRLKCSKRIDVRTYQGLRVVTPKTAA